MGVADQTGTATAGRGAAGRIVLRRHAAGHTATVTGSEKGTELSSGEALVLETYGLPLLSYLCATDEQSISERLRGDARLTAAAESVLMGELVPLARQIASALAARPELPRSFSLEILGERNVDGSTSIGTALHLASGGVLPQALEDIGRDDPVMSLLRGMAVDAFPTLLIPSDYARRTPRVSLFRHPARSALQAAIQADISLSRLFTADDPGLGRQGYALSSLGRGGSFQDVMFGEMVIASAWGMASMTRPDVNVVQLTEQININLAVLRDAVNGGQPRLPARLVFTGFTTQDATAIGTPWGPLRPMHDWERRLAPLDLVGSVSTTNAEGGSVTVSYAGEMVLETTAPYALVVVPIADVENRQTVWPKVMERDSLRRRQEVLELATLLGTDQPTGSWVTAKWAWSWTGDPFGHGGVVGWTDTRSPSFTPHELTPAECEAIGVWAELIHRRWKPRLDIAVRRLLSAANVRTDMADRLVDSVIVWENLFGTAQGEPRLRISAALAWLLGHDAAAREQLQLKLKDLYDYRSKIVHGGTPDLVSLGEQANAALTYARDALRALLRDRPDVLELPDGAARSLRVIMGG